MSKTYKPQRIGSSTYLCIPPHFFTPAMLKDGVRLTLLRKGDGACILKMEEANEKHNIGVKASGENASKSGFADFIRQVDRYE